METTEIKNLITRYNIDLVMHDGQEKLRIYNTAACTKENARDKIVAAKPEIIAYIKAERASKKAKAEDRQRRIAAIAGLAEIKAAQADLERWHDEWNASFEGDCGGMGVRKKPKYDFDALYNAYPVAAAYLKADAQANKTNYTLSEIGRKARESIIYDPDNYQSALDTMDAEIDANTQAHIWD